MGQETPPRGDNEVTMSEIPAVPPGSRAAPPGPAGPPGAAGGRSRRRVTVRIRLDFWLDVTLLAAYIVAYSFNFTGDVIHEWLGLGLGVALLLHLTLHWDWVIRTTARLLRRGGRDRLLYAVNLALLVVMTLCIASGVVISRVALPELGILIQGSLFWDRLHIATAEITLALAGVHVGLRWRWLVSVGRRMLGGPRRRTRGDPP
jgi:hypothetical protein